MTQRQSQTGNLIEQSKSLKELYVTIMEIKIDSLEKQNASFNRQIIKLGKKYGFGCARLLEGNRVDIREYAAYPGIRTTENLSPNEHFVYISTTDITKSSSLQSQLQN